MSGTPTATGTYTFNITATNSSSHTQAYSLTIDPAPLAITTPATLPTASLSTAYSQTMTATGGVTPYTWTTTTRFGQTGLPPGITLTSAGLLSGTPTSDTNSPYTFRLTVTDSATPTHTVVNQNESLTVTPKLAITTSTTLPSAPAGRAIAITALAATGGTTPYTWTTSTTGGQTGLPPGITVSSAGAFSGTPTKAGTYTFTVTVKDSASPQSSATQAESLTITGPTITSPAILPAGTAGVAYSQTLTATGGTTPYTWTSAAGGGTGLPAGFTVSTGGTLAGTPTAAESNHTYTFNITVTDHETPTANVTQAETLIITSSPTGVTATPETANSIKVAWSAVAGAARYNVLRSTTGVAGSYIYCTNVTTLNWTNIGLTSATKYWYEVVTVVGTGTATQVSSPSAAASTTTLATPPVPTGVTATAGTADSQINVSWNAVMGATSYTVSRSTTSGGPYTVLSRQAGTTFTNNGLTPSTRYYYVVTATTSVGTSVDSTQAAATTVAQPAAPTVTATTVSSTSIGVSWTAVPGATSYTVSRATTSGGPYTVVSRQAGTTFASNGLTPSTAYYYVVTATTPAGTSPQSAQATATTDS